MPEYEVTLTRKYIVRETRTIEAESANNAVRTARALLAEDEFFEFPDNLFFDGDEIGTVRRTRS